LTGHSLDEATKRLTGIFKARLNDVKQYYVGRDDVVDLLGMAAICREHVLLIGPPGTAKSSLLDRFARMLGAGYFSYLLTRFTEPAELFGPLNVRAFREESRYEVNTADMLPDKEIAFLDEIFQGSSAILNTLLSLVNERTFHNGSRRVPAKLLSMFGSANEIPSDPVLAAFSDRFLLRHRLAYVPEDDVVDLFTQGWSMERDLIRREVTAASNGGGPDPDRSMAVFGLDNLIQLQQALATIDLLPVHETFSEVVRSFRAEGVTFSDRRIVKAQKVIAASALLAGRAAAEDADLAVLCDMWNDEKDEPSIQRLVAHQGIPVAASRSTARVPAEIRLEWQELKTRADSVNNAPELHEVIGRLQRLKIETLRDHPEETGLSRDILAAIRAAIIRYRRLSGEEGLEDV
jgi:MoxR-like ATPase